MSSEIFIGVCIFLLCSITFICWGECCNELCHENQTTIERQETVVTPISNIIK